MGTIVSPGVSIVFSRAFLVSLAGWEVRVTGSVMDVATSALQKAAHTLVPISWWSKGFPEENKIQRKTQQF